MHSQADITDLEFVIVCNDCRNMQGSVISLCRHHASTDLAHEFSDR